MQVQAYLFFDGRCEEAIEFYRAALGAEVDMLMRYGDSPEPAGGAAPPGDKVMHAALRIGDTTVLMSDGHCKGTPAFEGFSLTIITLSEVEAEALFAALSDGGQVRMPLARTFFSPRFGMLTDRFGVGWMIYVSG